MIITTADKIRAQIKLHGKTQSDIAKELGVLPTNLTRTINNPRITLADLNKIADAIGCNVAEFFMDDYTPPQEPTITHEPTITCPYCGKTLNIHVD